MSTAIRHFRYIGVEFVQTWKWVEPGPLEYTTDDTVEEALGTEHQDAAQQWILFKDISAYTRDSKLTQIVSFCNTRSQGHFWGERDSCGYSGLKGVDFFLVGSCSVFHSIPFRSFRWWPKRDDVFAICWIKVPRLSCETSSSPSFRAPASRVHLWPGRKPSCHEKRDVLDFGL